MNANVSISRPELLKIFSDLQQKFSFSQQQDGIFKRECRQFQANMSQYLRESEKNIADNNPLSQQIENFIKVLEITNQKWQKK